MKMKDAKARNARIQSAVNIGLLGLLVCALSILFPADSARAQAANWNSITSAANKEGRVMLYWGGAPQALNRVVAGFKKAYPDIAIEFFRAAGGAILIKVDQERGSGVDGADVWVGGEGAWAVARAKEGKLLKPSGPASRDWPARYTLEGVIPMVSIEPMFIVYNKNLVSAPPTGYADLLKPEFKGKLGMSGLTSTALIAFYDWLEKTQGSEYLAKLHAQNPKTSGNVVTLPQSVASGELTASVTGILTATKPLMDAGAPIDYVVTKPGFGTSYIVSALGWSKRPNAALVLLDYIVSEDGQNAWNGKGEGVSMRPSVQGAMPAASVTTWDAADYPPEVAAKLRERWKVLFQ